MSGPTGGTIGSGSGFTLGSTGSGTLGSGSGDGYWSPHGRSPDLGSGTQAPTDGGYINPNLLDNSGQNVNKNLFNPPLVPVPITPTGPSNVVTSSLSKSSLISRGITGASGLVIGTFLTVDPSFASAWGISPGGYQIVA